MLRINVQPLHSIEPTHLVCLIGLCGVRFYYGIWELFFVYEAENTSGHPIIDITLF